MTIDELKERAEEYRAHLEKSAGKAIKFSKSGPASMCLIDNIIQILESQQKAIDDLREGKMTIVLK